jgi:hypothetical protein
MYLCCGMLKPFLDATSKLILKAVLGSPLAMDLEQNLGVPQRRRTEAKTLVKFLTRGVVDTLIETSVTKPNFQLPTGAPLVVWTIG